LPDHRHEHDSHHSSPTGSDGDEIGGLSGPPLRAKSTSLVRAIAAKSEIPVIGCGGISDAESAREKLEAGAALLQVYTGFIYRGPGLLREISVARATPRTEED
jgi:dihydroorotate dehydrogenase